MKTYKNSRKKYQLPTETPLEAADVIQETYSSFRPKFELSSIFGKNFSIQNDFDLINATRKGINKKDLLHLAKAMGLTQEDICKVLHISTRTFHRLPEESNLDIYTTEQAIEMALIFEKASEIFSSDIAIQMWLKTPIRSLNMHTPLSLLDTGFGARLVLDALSSIEEGVLA